MAHQHSNTQTTETTETITLTPVQKRRGFLPDGTHRDTGTDRDPKGRDIDGLDAAGFSNRGLHRDTGTTFDPDGYNCRGWNARGYNRLGADERGNREEFDMSRFELPILRRCGAFADPFTKRDVIPPFFRDASASSRRRHFDHSDDFDFLALAGFVVKEGRRWVVSEQGMHVLRVSLSPAEFEAMLAERARHAAYLASLEEDAAPAAA